MRKGPVRLRLDALAVIGAFLIGIGPGTAVQPCPKHRAAHGDEPEPRTATLHETHAEAAPAHSRAGHAHADGASENPHPHSGGPCDCLGTCLTCCGPALVASSPRAAQITSAWLRIARDAALPPARPGPGCLPQTVRPTVPWTTSRARAGRSRPSQPAWGTAGVRLVATRTGNIDGRDAAPSVNPQLVPTARTGLRAGTVVEGGLSLNLYIPRAKAFRVAGEVLLPLVRDLDGPQLETDPTFVLGLRVVPVSH